MTKQTDNKTARVTLWDAEGIEVERFDAQLVPNQDDSFGAPYSLSPDAANGIATAVGNFIVRSAEDGIGGEVSLTMMEAEA